MFTKKIRIESTEVKKKYHCPEHIHDYGLNF